MGIEKLDKSHVIQDVNNHKVVENKLIKAFLMVFGSLMVALGILGIFLPLLPTTVFFLLASACYIRSSSRMYKWLMEHKVFGKYLKNYLEKRGATVKTKIVSISILWISIGYSAIFAINDILWIQLLLMVIAIGVTIHLLMINTIRD